MLRLLPREKHELPIQIRMELRDSGDITLNRFTHAQCNAATLEGAAGRWPRREGRDPKAERRPKSDGRSCHIAAQQRLVRPSLGWPARTMIVLPFFGFRVSALDRKSTRLNSSHLGISYA